MSARGPRRTTMGSRRALFDFFYVPGRERNERRATLDAKQKDAVRPTLSEMRKQPRS